MNGNLLNDPNSTIELLEVHKVAYFPNQYLDATLLNGSSDECKNLCLNNYSCAASFFWNNPTIALSECFLASEELLSMYTTVPLSVQDLPEK